MGLNIFTLGSSKTYTRESLLGLGALKGANCTIKSTTKTGGDSIVTFEWTGTSGAKETASITVSDGVSIVGIDIDANNYLICTMSDGTEQKAKINFLDNVYTKTETDTLLLDKAEKNHNHNSAYASKDTEHEHTNKETLDKFGVNDGGKLTFNGDVVTPEASDLSDYLKKTDAQNTYVEKETGKGLSENDFTTVLKDAYDKAVEDSHTHTNKSIIDKFSESADGALLYDGQSIEADLSTVYKKTETYSQTEADNKFVAKETGKGLSTNDYTTEEKDKLASLDNYDDAQIKTQIQAVANGLMDSVGYSADYKTIDIIAKNGVKKSVNVAPIISHASITELSDVDTTNKATGKALVYNATTSKHEYADVSGTDEKVKMDASTDAKYLGELLDNITIANENGELKVKKLDGQEVTITEINYLKGLTMNVMDLVNMFSNGGVKIINTPVATYAELLTIDKSSFIEGISYLVYVLADENHDNAKTTYLVDKDSETPTYFGFADSQRDFATNPIDLATEITGKLGIANMDSDAIKALFTVDDTYKTETTTNNAFSTHGAKALYDELLLAIGNKANDSDLTAHKDDTDIHVSTEDRTKWDKVDNKIDKTSILTDISASPSDNNLLSEKAIKSELDKKSNNTDLDNLSQGILVSETSMNENILLWDVGYYYFNSNAAWRKYKNIPSTEYAPHVYVTSVKPTKYKDINLNSAEKNTWFRQIKVDGHLGKSFIRTIYTPDINDVINLENGKLLSSGSDTGWQRICTTSIEDVPKTAITFSDTTIYEPQITNFHNYYEVVDGECYVSLYVKAIAPTNQWTLINVSLPKPKRDEYKSLGVWENGTGNVICTIDQSGRLQLRFGTVGTIYIGTFRYKVAES